MRTTLLLIISFILQLILSKYLSYGGIGINILLILTIEISLIRGSRRGMWFGFCSGFIEDVFLMGVIGARSLVRTITGFLLGNIRGKFEVHNIMFQFILTFTVFTIHDLSVYIFKLIFAYPESNIRNIFIRAVLNGIIAPIMYYITEKTIAR